MWYFERKIDQVVLRPVLTYAAPALFTYLSSKRIATKIIYLEQFSYTERFICAKLTTLAVYMEKQCEQYFTKLLRSGHRLNKLHVIPNKQKVHRPRKSIIQTVEQK